MMRRALLLILLLLSLPARADMYQDARNAQLPAALQNLTNQILTISGGILQAGTGSKTPIFGSSAPTVLDIVKGTDAAPITTAGQQIRLLYRQAITKDKCFNNSADTGCNSPLLINAIGSADTTMVTSAATFYAGGGGTVNGADVQALNAISDVSGTGVGWAMGAYLAGRVSTATGHAFGAEISAGNYSGANICTVSPGGPGACDGIWLTARGNNATMPLSSAVHIGSGDLVSSWKQAITINTNAIFHAPATGTASFVDNSFSETSLDIKGVHTYGIRTVPETIYNGFGVIAPTARLVVGGDLAKESWASLGVAFRSDAATYTDTTSSGATGYSTAVNAFLIPTIAATNPTTYTSTATVYIQGCPISGANVTSPSCNALVVGGGSYFGDRVEVAGGMTASALPASAGGGGLYMCVDSAGVMYKKAACP